MKKRISFLLAVIMVLAVMIPAIPVYATEPVDSFSISDYDNTTEFTISTPKDMLDFYDAVYGQGKDFDGKTVKMANDIVMNDKTDYENWGTTAPANILKVTGITAVYFKGTFDGGNNTLTGVYNVKCPNSQWTGGVALFPFVNGTVTIKNLTIDGFYCGSDTGTTEGAVGAIVGRSQNACTLTIENCTVKNGIVSGDSTDAIGGLVGYAHGTKLTIKDSSINNVDVSGEGIVGGVIGICFSNNGTDNQNQPLIFDNFVEGESVSVNGVTAGGIIGKIINNAASGSGDDTYAPNGGYWTHFYINSSFMPKRSGNSLNAVGDYEIGEGASNNGYHLRIGTALGSNGIDLTKIDDINKAIDDLNVYGFNEFFAGVQIAADGSVRFVGVVYDYATLDELGFTLKSNGVTKTVTVTKVYDSLMAADKEVEPADGGKYFTFVVTGVEAGAAFEVSTYAKKGEAISNGITYTYTYTAPSAS